MAATAMNTVFTIQRMAAGTSGPAVITTGLPVPDRPELKGRWISQSGALCLEKSFWKLARVHWVGHQTGVTEFTSFAVLKAPVTIQ